MRDRQRGSAPSWPPLSSPAIGDLDGNPANGLEVVVGSGAWHADGTPVQGRPLATPLQSAVIATSTATAWWTSRWGSPTRAAPDRPVNLSLAAGNVLAWEDRSAVEDAYLVERSATGAAWSYETVTMLAPDSTSWTAPGGGYYRVRAARAGVPSRPSNAVSVP